MYPPADVIHEHRVNSTVTLEELNDALLQLHIPAVIFVVLCMVLGIFGNLLVFLIYKMKYRRSTHRYFILFLAALDFLACATGMPFLVASLTLPYLMPYPQLCKSFRYVHYLVNNSSGLLLLVISIERFRKICHPFKKQITHRQTLYLCYGTIFLSAIIAIPAALFYGSNKIETGINNLTGHQCYVDESHEDSILFQIYQSALLLETCVCVVIFIVLYAFIVRKLLTSDQFLQAMRSMQMTSHQRSPETSCSNDIDIEAEDDTSDSSFPKSKTANSEEELMRNGINGRKSMDKTGDALQPQPSRSCQDIKNGGAHDREESKSIWRLSREFFKLQRHNEEKPKLGRSTSDTALHKAKDKPRFRTLSPTERLVVGKTLLKMTSEKPSKPRKSKSSRTTARVTLMLFTVSVVFVLAFVPHLVLMIVTVADKNFLDRLNDKELIAYQVFLRSFILNNVANPFIYLFCDTKFRHLCKDLLNKLLCCKNK